MSVNDKIGREKRKKLKLFLVLVALLLIPTYLIPNNPLFYSTLSEMASNYGFFIFLLVVFPLLVLSTFRLGRRIQEGDLLSKIVNYLGFERSVRQVAIGLVMGSLTGLITWHPAAKPINSKIKVVEIFGKRARTHV